MARSNRIETGFHALFAATFLLAPLLAEAAVRPEPYRAVREVRMKAPSRPRLSRVLGRIEKSRQLVDEDVKKRNVSAEEGRKRRKDLAAIAEKTFASASAGRDLARARMETLDWELDQVQRPPSPKAAPRKERRVLAAASRKSACSADSYDCLGTWVVDAGLTNDLISKK